MHLRNPLRLLRLSTLLIAVNVGLLLFAVAGVAFVAVNLLQHLADDQALARVAQAGNSAQNAIAKTGEEMRITAQLLAERPTLRRLLDERDALALQTFLLQFQETTQLDGVLVLLREQVFAQSGMLSSGLIDAIDPASEDYFLQSVDKRLLMGAAAPVPSLPDAVVVVLIQVDASFQQHISDEIGLTVYVMDRQTALADGSRLALRSDALSRDSLVTARIPDQGVYLALLPLRAPVGEVAGLIETQLPATSIDDSLRRLIETLLLLALAVAAVGTLVSFLLGRWLGRPLRVLTGAAARIGHGDLLTPIHVHSGGEIGALTTTLEEMRRRLLELTADLRQQQAESDAIITHVVEGVFTVDRERRIRYLNPQAANMLGIDATQAIGRFCGDVLNPQGDGAKRPCEEDCPIVHARFRAGARVTEHLLLPSGRRRTVVIASAPPAEARQVQVMRDETDVEAARRLRDAVLANISHEFKTPLSAQLASIELLLDQLRDLSVDQIGELVLSLQRGTLRLTQLIDNLLESVRIEAGHDSLRHQALALDEVIEQALELTQPLLHQRDQDVIVDLPYPLPLILGDASRLVQVFVNLLANANKFSPSHTTIRIGGAVETDQVRLWVEDQGAGLPEPAGQSLFDRFVRSPGDEPEQRGVGLGLWIVKSIVERHGGRVDARSAANGTRMSVSLPLEKMREDSSR